MEGKDNSSKALEEKISIWKNRGLNLSSLKQFPHCNDSERIIPNHFCRCNIFIPTHRRGPHKMYNNELLASRTDVKIFYTGEQLTCADCNVFLEAIHIGRETPPGLPFTFTRAEFLKELGKADKDGKIAGFWYDWLEESLDRLTSAKLKIETSKYVLPGGISENNMIKETFHLIEKYKYDENLKSYTLTLDPDILTMFQNMEYTIIDWNKHDQIEVKVEMTEWLQRYVRSHNKGKLERVAFDDLKAWMSYGGSIRDFRRALKVSFNELKRISEIKDFIFDVSTRGREQVTYLRLAFEG